MTASDTLCTYLTLVFVAKNCWVSLPEYIHHSLEEMFCETSWKAHYTFCTRRHQHPVYWHQMAQNVWIFDRIFLLRIFNKCMQRLINIESHVIVVKHSGSMIPSVHNWSSKFSKHIWLILVYGCNRLVKDANQVLIIFWYSMFSTLM